MKNLFVLIVLLLAVPANADMTDKDRCFTVCVNKQVEWNAMCREKYKGFWEAYACIRKYKIVDDKCVRDCGCDPDRAGYGDMCK